MLNWIRPRIRGLAVNAVHTKEPRDSWVDIMQVAPNKNMESRPMTIRVLAFAGGGSK
jgi:hypothetical protein